MPACKEILPYTALRQHVDSFTIKGDSRKLLHPSVVADLRLGMSQEVNGEGRA